MSEPPPPLADLRARIDGIDAQILGLIEERAGLASRVAQAKAAESPGAPYRFGLRPAREAQVLRRLLDQPRAAAGDRLVVRLWRELMADNLMGQGPFSLALHGARPDAIMALARERFGSAPPATRFPSAQGALAAARTEGVVAVIDLEDPAPWWLRLLAEPNLVVFDALPPFVAEGPPAALAVAKIPLEPSGCDRTFLVVDTVLDAAETERRLGDAGLVGDLVRSVATVKLYALAGFVEGGDARLTSLPARLMGVIGAAPLPFDLRG